MTLKKCDRCGITSILTPASRVQEVMITRKDARDMYLDMCEVCLSALVEFLKPLPTQKV